MLSEEHVYPMFMMMMSTKIWTNIKSNTSAESCQAGRDRMELLLYLGSWAMETVNIVNKK